MKIVITGGPCAGKTTVTNVIAQAYPNNIVTVPEAASLLFSGGFPRWQEIAVIRSTQRAIFCVQHELETAFTARYPDKIQILDRAAIDGAAYWPDGAEDYFTAMGTSLKTELIRYDHVIYLASAGPQDYLIHKDKNPNRLENWEEASRLDKETLRLWQMHPSLTMVRNNKSFAYKMAEVLSIISSLVSEENEIEK